MVGDKTYQVLRNLGLRQVRTVTGNANGCDAARTWQKTDG